MPGGPLGVPPRRARSFQKKKKNVALRRRQHEPVDTVGIHVKLHHSKYDPVLHEINEGPADVRQVRAAVDVQKSKDTLFKPNFNPSSNYQNVNRDSNV